MSDIEAENKNLKEEQSEVSAPTEIGAPSVGSKDIRWYVIHTYSGYESQGYPDPQGSFHGHG